MRNLLIILFLFGFTSCSDFFSWDLPKISSGYCLFLNNENQFLSSANSSSNNCAFNYLNNSTKVTMSFWVKPVSFIDSSSSDLYRGVFNIASNNQSEYVCDLWLYEGPSGRIDFSVISQGIFGRASNENLIYGEWNHIAICIDLTSNIKFKCYVNGFDATLASNFSNLSSFPTTFNASLIIGKSKKQNAKSFNGYIDEISIWNNQTLNEQEILTIYNYSNTIQLSQFTKQPNVWYRMGDDLEFPYMLNYFGGQTKLFMNNMDESNVVLCPD